MARPRRPGVAGLSATAGRGAERRGCGRACGAGAVHGLGVHDQQLAAGLDVAGEPARRVARPSGGPRTAPRRAAGTRDDVGPEGEVGHELAVHDVPLDAVDAGLLERRAPPRPGGRSRRAAPTGRSRCGGRGRRRSRLDAGTILRSTGGCSAEPYVDRSSSSTTTAVAAGGDAAGAATPTAGSCSCAGALPGERVTASSSRASGDFARGARGRGARAVAATGSSRRARTWPRAAAAATGSTSRRPPSARCKARDRRRRAAPHRAASRRRRWTRGPAARRGLPHHACGARSPAAASASGAGAATTSSASTLPRRPPARSTSWSRTAVPRGRRGDAPGAARARASGWSSSTADRGVSVPTAWPWSAPTSCGRGAGPGSTRRSPADAGGSRPRRSSRPRPTAPSALVRRACRSTAADLAPGGRVVVDLYGGVGLFAGDAVGAAGAPR